MSDLDFELEFEDSSSEDHQMEMEYETEMEIEFEDGSVDLEGLLELEEQDLQEAQQEEDDFTQDRLLELSLEDLEEYQNTLAKTVKKLDNARSVAKNGRTEQIEKIRAMYETDAKNIINSIRQALEDKFKIAGKEEWFRELLGESPVGLPHDFKTKLTSVHTDVCNRLDRKESPDEVKLAALKMLSSLATSCNIPLIPQFRAYFEKFANTVVDLLREQRSVEDTQTVRVDELLKEYCSPVYEAKALIDSIEGEDGFTFVEEVNIDNSVSLWCECGCGPIKADSLAYIYTNDRGAVSVFAPVTVCKACKKPMLFTTAEYTAIKKRANALIANYTAKDDNKSEYKVCTVHRPLQILFKDALPHLVETGVVKQEDKITEDDLFDLLEWLQPHVDAWKRRIDSYNVLGSVPIIQGTTENKFANIKGLCKYITAVNGEEYANLKEYALSTILESFSKDPMMRNVSRFLDDVGRKQFEQAQAVAGMYDHNYPQAYYWMYSRVTEATGLPYDTVLNPVRIEDELGFEELNTKLVNMKLVDFDFAAHLENLVPYLMFKPIELTPLNKFKWKGLFADERMRSFLDTTSDLMILSHFALELFNDYDANPIVIGNKLAKKKDELRKIIYEKDTFERKRVLGEMCAKMHSPASYIQNNLTLHYFDFSDDLLYFRDLLVALQMGDAEVIKNCAGICNYLINVKGAFPAEFLNPLRDVLQKFPSIEPVKSHFDFVVDFYKDRLNSVYTESDIREAQVDGILLLDENLVEIALSGGEKPEFADLISGGVNEAKHCVIQEEYCELYLYVYGFVTYFHSFIYPDENRSFRHLMIELLYAMLSVGKPRLALPDIDNEIFSSIVTQVEDFTFDDMLTSDAERLQYLLGSSISADTRAQDICSRAYISGVMTNGAGDAVLESATLEYKPVDSGDIGEILATIDAYIFPEEVESLISKLWPAVTEIVGDDELCQ